jgi:nucleoside-diphosphate-sugar epimerase
MTERVLVTGATGFVGSHVAEAFVEAGYEVRCSVRTSSNTRWIDSLAVERVNLDLARPQDLPRALEDVDVVVHAAGVTRARRPGDYHRINAGGTRTLATAAASAAGRRFVFISSLAAGGPDNALAKDGRDRPASAYGYSKLEAEEYLRAGDARMDIVALRLAAVYGPRDTDLLPLFKIARSGWLAVPSAPGLLQPVYAADAARAALAAAREPGGFGPHPVAETNRYTWQDIADGLELAFGRPVRAVRLPAAVFKLAGRSAEWVAKLRGVPAIFDERRAKDLAEHTWSCDPSGTERALGWRAEVRLFEGLERTARWYRRMGWI